MPNLLDIKDRITSIKNTQKITRAMKMVAAAKVKKSENRVKAGRPFSKALVSAFKRVLDSVDNDAAVTGLKIERAIDNYPALMKKRELKTAGILMITSNKGLAGAYNANVIRYTLKKIQTLKEQNIDAKLYIVGQKGLSGIRRKAQEAGVEIVSTYTKISQEPNSSNAIVIAEDMAKDFVEGKIAPIAGAISMDMLTIDVTDIPEAQLGSEVELWGANISVNDVAKRCGTIGYELMCAIALRVPMLEDEN